MPINTNTVANPTPIFSLIPVIGSNIITGSNPAKGAGIGFGVATGNYTQIISGNKFGTRVEFLRIFNTGTNTAAVVRLFLDNSKVGTNVYSYTGIYLFQEVVTSAVTASATVAGYTSEITRTDGRPLCILPSGVILSATASAQDPNGAYIVQAYGGDF